MNKIGTACEDKLVFENLCDVADGRIQILGSVSVWRVLPLNVFWLNRAAVRKTEAENIYQIVEHVFSISAAVLLTQLLCVQSQCIAFVFVT